MTPPAAPPRLARALLRLLTPEPFRDAVDGDLLEGFHRRVAGGSGLRARVWYWRQLASLDVLRLRLAHPRRRGPRILGLGQDTRFALRSLRRQPAFTTVALLTLAVGIGACTAVFTVVRGVLLRPLPYTDAHQLVMVFRTVPRFGFQRSTASYPDFADWRAGAREIIRLAAYAPATVTARTPEGAERWTGYRATADLASVLGTPPAIGRWFTEAEDRPGAPRVIVLGHALWQSRFGEDPGIAGRAVTLDGEAFLVVGVMPPAFAFPSEDTQFWMPLRGDAAAMERDANFLVVIGRLAPGVPPGRAQADLGALAARIDADAPDGNEGYGLFVEPRHAFVVRDARAALQVFAGAVVLVLLIACANVAGLLVTRGARRARELAVRAALGAGTGRLARQLLTESAVLGLAGGLLGWLVAAGLLRLFVAAGAGQVPRLDEARLDGAMLGFTLMLALGCGVGLGMVGAWTAVRGRLMSGLRAAAALGTPGPRARRLQRAFVVVQVSVAVVLSLGAGLLVHSFMRITAVQPGFDPAGLVAARLEREITPLPEPSDSAGFAALAGAAEARLAFFTSVRTRAAALPGIRSATLAWDLPFGRHSFSRTVVAEGRERATDDAPAVAGNIVVPGYFTTMGIPVRRGRPFTDDDHRRAPSVAVISDAMARAFWPGEDPVGRRFRLGDAGNPWTTVVGVVGDVRQRDLGEAPAPMYYRPLAQVTWPDAMFLLVRSPTPTASVVAALRSVVRELDPGVPLTEVASSSALIERTVSAPRFRAVVLVVFAAAALLVAVAGVYGVTTSAVQQRRREFGIRMALGADARTVVAGVIREGVILAGAGVIVGLVGATVGTRLLAGFLFGLTPHDPATYVVVVLSVVAATGLACYFPARRAAVADPLETLQAD